jgi:general secretion pathway protein F
MEHLSGFVETRAKNRQTVQLALLYPAILALVSLAVIVALLTFVVPDIVRVFTSRGAELPLLTRTLIGLSDLINDWGLVMGAAIAGMAAGAALALRRPAVRMRWHRLLATAPVTRRFALKSNAAQFAGTLATLTVSRVPLIEALGAAAQTVPNLYVRKRVEIVSTRVREGVALSAALTEAGVFPPMMIAMVASGEAGGPTPTGLLRTAWQARSEPNSACRARGRRPAAPRSHAACARR